MFVSHNSVYICMHIRIYHMSRSNILRTEGPRRITPAPISGSKGNNVKDTHALKAGEMGMTLNLIPPPPEALNLLRRISGRTQEDDQAAAGSDEDQPEQDETYATYTHTTQQQVPVQDDTGMVRASSIPTMGDGNTHEEHEKQLFIPPTEIMSNSGSITTASDGSDNRRCHADGKVDDREEEEEEEDVPSAVTSTILTLSKPPDFIVSHLRLTLLFRRWLCNSGNRVLCILNLMDTASCIDPPLTASERSLRDQMHNACYLHSKSRVFVHWRDYIRKYLKAIQHYDIHRMRSIFMALQLNMQGFVRRHAAISPTSTPPTSPSAAERAVRSRDQYLALNSPQSSTSSSVAPLVRPFLMEGLQTNSNSRLLDVSSSSLSPPSSTSTMSDNSTPRSSSDSSDHAHRDTDTKNDYKTVGGEITAAAQDMAMAEKKTEKQHYREEIRKFGYVHLNGSDSDEEGK